MCVCFVCLVRVHAVCCERVYVVVFVWLCNFTVFLISVGVNSHANHLIIALCGFLSALKGLGLLYEQECLVDSPCPVDVPSVLTHGYHGEHTPIGDCRGKA